MANQERYVIIDNGDGSHSVRDTVDQHWEEHDNSEDMTPEQALALKTRLDS